MIYRDENSNTIVCASRWYRLRNQIYGAIKYLTDSEVKIPCAEQILLSLKEVEQSYEKRREFLDPQTEDKVYEYQYKSMVGLHELFDDIQEEHILNFPKDSHILAVRVMIKKMFS